MVFTPAEVLNMVSLTKFEGIDEVHRMGFMGVTDENAKIGEYGDYILIIDGDILAVIDDEGNEMRFTMDLAE